MVSLPVMLAIVLTLVASERVHAVVFQCPARDVACLIAAIHTVNGNGEDDTIQLEAGTYTLTTVDNETDGPNGLPSITSPITITGAGAEATIIAREATAPRFRIFHLTAAGTLRLDGLSIIGGVIQGSEQKDFSGGGGLLNQGATVAITNSTVAGNRVTNSNGGGLLNQGGTVTITDSTFTSNGVGDSARGGGIANTGTVTITNSTVAGNTTASGEAGGSGGGISNDGTLIITNSTIADNGAEISGGIENRGTLIVENSTFTGNSASDVGGIGNGGTLTITNSTIADNGARLGGGIGNRGMLTITNSTIADNSANEGGGIRNGGTLTITNSTVAGNVADDRGGGIYNPGGTVLILNSTVANNRVGEFGGGILNEGGTVSILNSIVAGNTRDGEDGSGGGILNEGGTVELQNTILALNQTMPNVARGPDCAGPVTSLGHNLIGDPAGCAITLQASDLTGDPGLGEYTDDETPGRGHFPLLASSRAINAGNDAVCPETDQLGQPRVGICDIGAIEFQPQAPTVAIDIKPGSSSNTINPTSNGVIPVALLTTDIFDATTVNPLSVHFGPNGATEAHGKEHIEDVNEDGEPDLMLHFRTQDTGIECGQTSASLTGETFAGDPIEGTDTIKTVGCMH